MKIVPSFEMSVSVGYISYEVIELIVLEVLHCIVYKQSPQENLNSLILDSL